MQTFNGTLEVQVEQGTVAATKSLLFDLVGEGTLPHVSIEKPAARSEAGVPLLQFPRYAHPPARDDCSRDHCYAPASSRTYFVPTYLALSVPTYLA